MYFGVSNGRYKSSQLTGSRTGPSPPPASNKMPRNVWLMGFSLRRDTERLGVDGGEGRGVKKRFSKIPSTQSRSQKRKAPIAFKSFPRKPLSCPSRGRRMERGKKNALQERWGSDKRSWIKGLGIAFKFLGSHWSAWGEIPSRLDPSFVPFGLGTELPQWDGVLFQSPVISALPDAAAGLCWARQRLIPSRSAPPKPLRVSSSLAEGHLPPLQAPAECHPTRPEQGEPLHHSAPPIPRRSVGVSVRCLRQCE